ncbi:SpvB/TcaC N-terminal domain-containing protein [Streptomyces sp. NPDC001339]|uniref:SpvB/TcaC N-terminal domain-containing protein n=1 Tax=Streptomyces sp. NPDC001339 TaxID=3364563 RepID=UPI00368A2716
MLPYDPSPAGDPWTDRARAHGSAPADGAGRGTPQTPAAPAVASPASAPSVSLPKGGGAIRGIGEKFSANPVTGTGTLSVPLAVSPGRSGFGPSLELSYDSGAGNGPFGLGWHLGLPSVSRKTDKGVPAYRDEPVAGGDPLAGSWPGSDVGPGAAEDTFVLSGAEDLVPVLDGQGHGHGRGHWAPVERARTEAGRTFAVRRYRPRTEGLFARIERWTDTYSGETHWRSVSKENVTTVYGRSAQSRVADPCDPGRVSTWLICESYDGTGNAIRYEYKAEDAVAVDLAASHERNRGGDDRSAQRYLKRIRYGNRLPAWASSEEAGSDGSGADWLFEVVFDYGEHDEQNPVPAEVRPWTCRADPFSTYRSGFEVRSYRLCHRMLMFHHFPDEPGVGADCLVRATEFTYRGDPVRGEPVVSCIESVRQRGFRRRPGGGYLSRSLPPLELGYSEARVDDRVHTLDPESLAGLPAGLDGTTYRWIDLDGEGLSGALTEQAGAWFYTPNLGGGRFGPVRAIGRPSQGALGGGRQELLDLAGDGRPDLVELGGPLPGFTERTEDRDWGVFRPFRARPDIDWHDPGLRFVDLSGDGHADVLITGEQVFTWHPALGADGFGAAGRVWIPDDEERGPRLVFADRTQSIHLADMSGDGLADLVRIRNGETCYWPNLGHGRFGAKVAMDDAPWLDDADLFGPSRVRLADVDGSGTADLIYLHPRGARLFANQAGNRWGPARPLGVPFPRADDAAQVSAVDLLGNGTACLVWSSALPGDTGRQLRYLDLTGGQKPHLLVSARNNLGAETHIRYAPSTRFSVADQEAGRPWATRLPFPVHVVERVETADRINRNRFTTRYAYHHGYFDGVEREFRGFGMVEQWDTEVLAALGPEGTQGTCPDAANLDPSSYVPPVLTRTWFHTGAFLDGQRISRQYAHEYFADDLRLPDSVLPEAVRRTGRTPLPWRLSADETRQAHRALKGLPLRQEVYALDGSAAEDRPYLVTEHNYTVELLQPAVPRSPDATDLPLAVFLSSPRETLTAHYERQTDPRIGHELVLDVDDYGNALRSASVGYGRRHPDPDPVLTPADREAQQRPYVMVTENDYTNAVDTTDAHRTPRQCAARSYEIRGLAPRPTRYAFAELRDRLAAITVELPYEAWDATPATGARRLIEHTRTLFRRDDLTGPLPLGSLQALALPYESYRRALSPGLPAALYGDRVDAAMLAESGYVEAEGAWWVPSGRSFYSPDASGGPAAESSYARRHFFLPHRFRDPFGATTTVRYDGYDLLVTGTEDALGNLVTVGERDAEERALGNGNDYRVLQPRLVTDANRNRAEVCFDALGRVAGTAVRGKREERLGDSLAGFDPDPADEAVTGYLADPPTDPAALLGDAGTRVVYDPLAYWRTRDDAEPQPCVTATLAREIHTGDLAPSEHTRVQHKLDYSDGFGRTVQSKSLVEPGPLTDGGPELGTRWAGTGWTIFDNKGNPVREYEPFFTATHRFEFAAATGVGTVRFYDPVGRVVAELRPDATYAKTVFGPWRQETWDGNDTVLTDPRRDPDVAGYVSRHLDGIDGWTTWYTRRVDGRLGPAEQRAAEQTALHAGTPARSWSDSLGRTFLTVAHNRFLREGNPVDEISATRSRLDIEGNERELRDALGRAVVRYGYDMLGSRVARSGMDTGGGVLLADVVGKPRYSWNSRGFRFRTEYDPLHRPARSWVQGPGLAGEVLQHRTEYGEGQPDAAARNLRGQVHRRFDESGVATHESYDFKGNLLAADRRLTRRYQDTPDWNHDVETEERSYPGTTRYDALNRPTSVTTPDGSVLHPVYNEAGLLHRLTGRLRGAAETTVLVARLDYNARGQRTHIAHGNGSRTGYTYDPATFRLTGVRTERNGRRLQDLAHTYDPVGNITAVDDRAQQTVFFRNQAVRPEAAYVYDALYRLVEATGREHLGQTGPVPPQAADALRAGLSHPGDGAAMSRYIERYVYDAVGNIQRVSHRTTARGGSGWTRAYAYAEPSLLEPGRHGNRLSHTTAGGEAAPPQPFRYDQQGSITEMPELPVMCWDPQDRLRSSARQAVADGVPETTYYVYDATGQRVRKVTESATAAAGAAPRRMSERIYLGAFEIHREFGADGQVSVERETLHVLDDQQRIALVETRTLGDDAGPEQLIRYQLTDHLGSSVLELDETARVISYEEYYPYGSTSYQAVRAGTETPKRYRFTGKERDTESGLSYHGARYYAPWLGRWISSDPEGTADGPNGYEYARSSPTRFVDPTGRSNIPFTDADIDQALSRLESGARAVGKGLRGAAARINIDEIQAVARGGSWDDPANKQFLESMTNQVSKGARIDPRVVAPRPPFSLAQAATEGEEAFRRAAGEMLTRPFSEVQELEAITRDARGAMTSLNRTPRKLADAINSAIRRRIATGATTEAGLVNRALRTVGIDPSTLTQLPQQASAAAGQAPAAAAAGEGTAAAATAVTAEAAGTGATVAKTAATAGRLARAAGTAARVVRAAAPVLRAVGKVAGPVALAASLHQAATAQSTADKADAAVNVSSSALAVASSNPVTGIAAGALVAGGYVGNKVESAVTEATGSRAAGVASGTLAGAATGAAIGAVVGSIVPGVGTAVGAGVGAAAGAVGGFIRSYWK